MPGTEFLELGELADGRHAAVVERRSGDGEAFEFGQDFEGREARAGEAAVGKRDVKEGGGAQVGERGERGEARVGDLHAVGAEFLECGQAGEERQGFVGQAVALAVEREGLEGLELAEVAELRLSEFGAVFETDFGDGAGGLGDLRAEGAELGGERGVVGRGGVRDGEEGQQAGGEAEGQGRVGEEVGCHRMVVCGCDFRLGILAGQARAWRKVAGGGRCIVAQASKPAVSPISKSAARRNCEGGPPVGRLAGWETRDTAGLETCATTECRTPSHLVTRSRGAGFGRRRGRRRRGPRGFCRRCRPLPRCTRGRDRWFP